MYAGSKTAPAITDVVKDKDEFKVGDNIQIRCIFIFPSILMDILLRYCSALHTPCHTQDSICFYAHDVKTDEKGVFTGCVMHIVLYYFR